MTRVQGIKYGAWIAAISALAAAIYLSYTDRYVAVESKGLGAFLSFSCGKGLFSSTEYKSLVQYYSSTPDLVETGVGQRIEAECQQEKAVVLGSYLLTGALCVGVVVLHKRESNSTTGSKEA